MAFLFIYIYKRILKTKRTQGIFAAPEGGATLAAFMKLRSSGWIKDFDKVVLFNTGSGHKYANLWIE